MGISMAIAKALIQEHKYRPFSGEVAFLGRQSVALTVEEAQQIVYSEAADRNLKVDIHSRFKSSTVDIDTRSASGMNWITEKSFFSLFSDAKLTTIDVTDYEKCDIVHDFTKPVPDTLKESFDSCWLGSCLDNISNPFQALKNASDILKPGGRLINFEICTSDVNAYLAYPPGFFLDWLAVNKFENVKFYLMVFNGRSLFRGTWNVYALESSYPSYHQVNFRSLPFDAYAVTFWIADKSLNPSEIQSPVQGQYRPKALNVQYDAAFDAWLGSSVRPQFKLNSPESIFDRFLRKILCRFIVATNYFIKFIGLKVSVCLTRFTAPDLKGFKYIGRI